MCDATFSLPCSREGIFVFRKGGERGVSDVYFTRCCSLYKHAPQRAGAASRPPQDRRQGAPLRAECDARRARARRFPGNARAVSETPEPCPGTPESASAASVRSVGQLLKVPQVLLFTWSGLVLLPGEPAVSVEIINSCV